MTPRSGLEVIGAMRRAYPSRALKSLTFSVSTTEYDADSSTHTAVAHAALPGRFRVTELPKSRRSAVVRNQNRIAVFERGRLIGSHARIDLSGLLAYDVFAQGVDTTIRRLDEARVRYGPARADRFDGRDVWVVGAADGDSTSAQFWVDADRWRVLRVIQRDPRSPARVIDVRYREFTEVLDVPVPQLVEVHRGGRLVERHVISQIISNPSVPKRVFDVSKWSDVR